MNKLYLKNIKIEFIIIMVLSLIGLYYDFERIIFFSALFIFIFRSLYCKYRNKNILINKKIKLIKLLIYIYIIIVLIRYFFGVLSIGDNYLFYHLLPVFLLYGLILLYQKIKQQNFKSISLYKNLNTNRNLIYMSLFLNLFHLVFTFYNDIFQKLFSVIIHFIIIRNLDMFYIKFIILIAFIISFSIGNFVSCALLFICFLNTANNNNNIEEEIEKIKNIKL